MGRRPSGSQIAMGAAENPAGQNLRFVGLWTVEVLALLPNSGEQSQPRQDRPPRPTSDEFRPQCSPKYSGQQGTRFVRTKFVGTNGAVLCRSLFREMPKKPWRPPAGCHRKGGNDPLSPLPAFPGKPWVAFETRPLPALSKGVLDLHPLWYLLKLRECRSQKWDPLSDKTGALPV